MRALPLVTVALVTLFSCYTTLVSGKASRRHHIEKRGKVKDWASALLNEVKNGAGAKCMKVKAAGKTPTGDVSPIKNNWGTPIPKFEQRLVILKPTAEINHEKIIIGTKEFAFLGTQSEILAFCGCYENVKIVGKTIDARDPDTNEWKLDTGEIKIQIADASEYKGNEGPIEILFALTLDKITRYISPVNSLLAESGPISALLKESGIIDAKSISDLAGLWKKLKDLLPMEYDKEVVSLLDSTKSHAQKAKELIGIIMRQEGKRLKALQWAGPENVSNVKKGRMSVKLTMYDKPISTVRATYNMKASSTTLKEVGQVLQRFFKA